MPSCVYRRCTNYTATARDRENISFHALPKDRLTKEKWLNIIRTQRREDDWMPTMYSTVCSEHFLASDVYITKKNVRRLKKTAVPVIMQEEQNIKSSSTNLEQVNVYDEDSISDTPRKEFLKTKIRKISLDKRQLQFKHYNLVRKYKRLKKKWNTLKQIVLELRNKKKIFHNRPVE